MMKTRIPGLLVAVLAGSLAGPAHALEWPEDFAGWWQTPDQQGERLASRGRYLEAAEVYRDPVRKGAAYFRGGDFESAASVYGRVRGPEAAYNRGNALIMLGRYEQAIESFEAALATRPDWAEAQQNLDIARARLQRLAPPDSDAGGTGGQLGADEIVFDQSGRVDEGGTEVITEGDEAMAEEEMRAVWLRRVRADPADFLAARFAYQLYRQEQEATDEAPAD